MFKNQESAASWLDFYMGYEFLEPDLVGKFGFENPNKSLEDNIESRVARYNLP